MGNVISLRIFRILFLRDTLRSKYLSEEGRVVIKGTLLKFLVYYISLSIKRSVVYILDKLIMGFYRMIQKVDQILPLFLKVKAAWASVIFMSLALL